MTQEDIIRMAREAGIDDPESDWIFWNAIERFAALVAASEREACAKLCEAGKHSEYDGHAECAAAIRSRSNA